MRAFKIQQIVIYPVRSLGGMRVAEAEITVGGSLTGDREWVVTRPDGSLLWQGDIPQMALLSARIEGSNLILKDRHGVVGPNPRDEAGGFVRVKQDGFTLCGLDQGDAVARWLTGHLGTACRLVRVGLEAHRWGGLNPVHVVSEISLGALNARLLAIGQDVVQVERFRPNIVLSGSHSPFEEELAAELLFGDASLLLLEACVRCELPNISLKDATRGKQPLKLLGAMSRERPSARPASFGTYCMAKGEALSVGMSTIGS